MMRVYETKQEAQEAIDNLPDPEVRKILMVYGEKDALKRGKDGYIVQLKPFKAV